jgi:hypothetical protein
MHYAYSFALEYARSACCGDCTSTMLSHRGVTFRDPRRREAMCPPVRMV